MDKVIVIPEWKLEEIRDRYGNNGFVDDIIGVVRETEKAVCVRLVWAYCSTVSRTIEVWMPKSCLKTKEEIQAEQEAAEKRFNDACNRYYELIEWCKANGVKGVRSGMRKETIMNKIKAAGLEYVA